MIRSGIFITEDIGMKKFYRMFRRGPRYYIEHVETRKQTSLGTGDYNEALRLFTARNEAAQAPCLNLALARTYLSAHDQTMIERSWSVVMTEIISRTTKKSRPRYERAMKDHAFNSIRDRKLIQTTSEDFLAVMRIGLAWGARPVGRGKRGAILWVGVIGRL